MDGAEWQAPWWVLLGRWLNRGRVCAVPDCIGLAEGSPYCAAHADDVRERRARLGRRRCAREGCPRPREGGPVYGGLCRGHGDEALLRERAAAGRWNVPPSPVRWRA